MPPIPMHTLLLTIAIADASPLKPLLLLVREEQRCTLRESVPRFSEAPSTRVSSQSLGVVRSQGSA